MLPVFKKTALLCCLFSAWLPRLTSQESENLLADEAFFRKKLPEFAQWLYSNRLHKFFRADSIAVTADQVTLFLRPNFSGQRVCDSTQCIWQHLETSSKQHAGHYFHEKLLKKWAFLCEIDENQAQVVVRCHEPAHFLARVSCVDGKTVANMRNLRSAGVVRVALPVGSVGGVNAGENRMLLTRRSMSRVVSDAKYFFVEWYKNKGTPVLWRARIDTTYSFEDEFIVEVTHMSNQICPKGYYEYHRIYVQGIQLGEDVLIRWEFQGKYGSGVVFPPRKNDYKDLATHYKTELENYQKLLFKRLITYLSRK